MKNGILKFVPFSEMKETPTAWDTPYTQRLNELKADTEGRSVPEIKLWVYEVVVSVVGHGGRTRYLHQNRWTLVSPALVGVS